MKNKQPQTRMKMIFQFLKGAKIYFCLGILFACLYSLANKLRPKVTLSTVDVI